VSGLQTVHQLLLQLGIILFWALVLGSIFERLGLPSILGYTLAGYTLGPQGLNVVQSSEFLQILADLGIILLLFYIGLEFNIRKLLESGAQALVISPIKSGIGFLLGFSFAKLLGFDFLASLVAGAAVAVSSTGIISHNILEKKLQHTPEARVVMSMLILEDIFSVTFLAFLLSQNGGVPFTKVLLHTILILVLILTVGIYLSRWFFRLIKRLGHEDKIALYALGLLVLFSYGVAFLGISPSLGAFFAGVALSEVAAASRIERELEMLKRFFVLVFFISIGLFYAPVITFRSILLALGLLVAQVTAVLAATIVAPFVGLTIRSAARLFILDLPVGEFSLFFAATASMVGIEGAQEILGAVFILVFITAAISNKLFEKEEKVLDLLRRWLSKRGTNLLLFNRYLSKTRTSYVDSEYVDTVRRYLGRIAINFVALLSIAYLAGYAVTEAELPARWVFLIALILAVYPLYAILMDLLKLISYHVEKLLKTLLPKMDYFERRVAAKRASVMALGILIYMAAVLLNLLAQASGIVTLQMLALLFLIIGIGAFIYGALNLLSFFVLR